VDVEQIILNWEQMSASYLKRADGDWPLGIIRLRSQFLVRPKATAGFSQEPVKSAEMIDFGQLYKYS